MDLLEELKKLQDEEFLLKMKDRWDDSDFNRSYRLQQEIKELEEKINGR